jgi:hypothetical protein
VEKNDVEVLLVLSCEQQGAKALYDGNAISMSM